MPLDEIVINDIFMPRTPDAVRLMERVVEARHHFAERVKVHQGQLRDKQLNKFLTYEHNPVGFVTDILGEEVWSKQREIMESVDKNRRTSVPSAHDVGKSFIAARIAAWWLCCSRPGDAFVVTTAPTFAQVKNILWREIARAYTKGKLPGRMNQTEWYMTPHEGAEEIVAFGRKPSDYDPSAFQGIHQLKVLVLFDEACGVPKALFDAADTLLTNAQARALSIGNPDDPSTEFAQISKPGSGWNVVPISAYDSPNFTGEVVSDRLRQLLISPTWVDEKKLYWGEESPLFKSKILGLFPEDAADGLIPYSGLVAAVNRELTPGEPNELGVDVARFGGDMTVMYHRRGDWARRHKRFGNRDLMYTVGEIVHAVRTLKITKVKIDDIGLGGGVTDRLKEMKREAAMHWDAVGKDPMKFNHERYVFEMIAVDIMPVNVGMAATLSTDKMKFKNLRAQYNWEMRLRVVDGRLDLDNDLDLLGQAGQIRYWLDSTGHLIIEPKDEMKVRLGGRSPDDWDALVLAFAEPRLAGTGFLQYANS